VDEANKIVDVLFKFAANKQIVLHRHKADYRTLVIQGELRIYRANGDIKEIRPVGSYVFTPAGGEPHREVGGDQMSSFTSATVTSTVSSTRSWPTI
jgi:2,4'-dihydroxyacetophenone dioxygenase